MNECILVVDDDREIVKAIAILLEKEDYRVLRAYDGMEALDILAGNQVQLLIIDVMMPRLDGLSAVMRIREKRNLPIIVLSAKSEDSDKILGLSMGADDYVTKPFRMQELLVRMQAILRRSSLNKEEYYQSGDMYYNHFTHQMIEGKEALPLTSVELKIAVLLLKSWPNTITRKDLLYHVWDSDFQFVEENTLNVNVSRLRDKLGTFEEAPYITTIRGVGYRWAVPVKRCQKPC